MFDPSPRRQPNAWDFEYIPDSGSPQLLDRQPTSSRPQTTTHTAGPLPALMLLSGIFITRSLFQAAISQARNTTRAQTAQSSLGPPSPPASFPKRKFNTSQTGFQANSVDGGRRNRHANCTNELRLAQYLYHATRAANPRDSPRSIINPPARLAATNAPYHFLVELPERDAPPLQPGMMSWYTTPACPVPVPW